MKLHESELNLKRRKVDVEERRVEGEMGLKQREILLREKELNLKEKELELIARKNDNFLERFGRYEQNQAVLQQQLLNFQQLISQVQKQNEIILNFFLKPKKSNRNEPLLNYFASICPNVAILNAAQYDLIAVL